MKNVRAPGATCKVVDLSHYQQHVDWPALKAEGVVMAIAKASEGVSIADDMYERHIENATAYGILTGAYHFFHPSQDPVAQAKHFLSIAGKQKFMALDWETTDKMPTKADRDAGWAFLEVLAAAGKQKWLYTGPYFGAALALDARFADAKLWIAHYGPKPEVGPLVPAPFRGWDMWQYSDASGMDHNLFNGTEAELRALVG